MTTDIRQRPDALNAGHFVPYLETRQKNCPSPSIFDGQILHSALPCHTVVDASPTVQYVTVVGW